MEFPLSTLSYCEWIMFLGGDKQMPLEITQREINGIYRLALKGRLVFGEESSGLRTMIDNLLASGVTRIVVNLEHVNYVDSAGLASALSSRRIERQKPQAGASSFVILDRTCGKRWKSHSCCRYSKCVRLKLLPLQVSDDGGKRRQNETARHFTFPICGFLSGAGDWQFSPFGDKRLGIGISPR